MRRPTPGLGTALALLVVASLVGAGGPGFAVAAAAGTPDDLEDRLIDLHIFPLDSPPPPLALPGLDGKHYDLAQAKGQVVLVYFWASW